MKNPKSNLDSNTAWYIWLFPLIAILITGWLFFEYVRQRGPEIRITFDDASSLQAEKTRVRFRGVTVGIVKRITLSEDNKDVIAHVQLQKDAEHLAVKGSKFWVVMPKVNFQGVSGLETLFEGTYIAVLPGPVEDEDQYDFKGHVGADSSDPLEDTTTYWLETANAGSLSPGDAVTFRGLKVGSVTKIELAKDSRRIAVQINLQNKYVKLVRTNTVFWRKIAVQAKLGLFNSELKIGSLDSILHGGIDLFTPDDAGPMAKAHAKFDLSEAPPKGYEKWNPKLEF